MCEFKAFPFMKIIDGVGLVSVTFSWVFLFGSFLFLTFFKDY